MSKKNTVKLRIIEEPRDPITNKEAHKKAQPGDMWKCWWDIHKIEDRPECWMIKLGGDNVVWHTNDITWSKDEFWQIIGEAPDITVFPSIDIKGFWHGFIDNGEMWEIPPRNLALDNKRISMPRWFVERVYYWLTCSPTDPTTEDMDDYFKVTGNLEEVLEATSESKQVE